MGEGATSLPKYRSHPLYSDICQIRHPSSRLQRGNSTRIRRRCWRSRRPRLEGGLPAVGAVAVVDVVDFAVALAVVAAVALVVVVVVALVVAAAVAAAVLLYRLGTFYVPSSSAFSHMQQRLFLTKWRLSEWYG